MPIIQFVVWALVAVVASQTLVLQPAVAAAAADDDVEATPKRRRSEDEPSSWSYLDDTLGRCVSAPTSFPTTSLHQPPSPPPPPPAADS